MDNIQDFRNLNTTAPIRAFLNLPLFFFYKKPLYKKLLKKFFAQKSEKLRNFRRTTWVLKVLIKKV